mgnify:CR=1 FL=1
MTRLESIKNNAYLLDLNMTRATKEQKIQWLCQIIDNETDKPEDEMDFALIDECSAYLRELSDKAAEATKEQKQRILQQIKAHHNQTATKSAKVLRPNWRKVGRIVAIAATVAALLLSSLTVLAKVNGYSNAWEYVKENVQKIIGLDAGDRMNDDGITLIKHGTVIAYNSIEELLLTEGYDIMYPSELPDGIEMTKISQQIIDEDYILYSIQFTDSNLSVVISTQYNVPEETLEKYDMLEHSLLRAYVVKQANGVYQIIAMDDKYEYLFYGNNYDVLIAILNGMKGIGK